jgi:hypothetical protein
MSGRIRLSTVGLPPIIDSDTIRHAPVATARIDLLASVPSYKAFSHFQFER